MEMSLFSSWKIIRMQRYNDANLSRRHSLDQRLLESSRASNRASLLEARNIFEFDRVKFFKRLDLNSKFSTRNASRVCGILVLVLCNIFWEAQHVIGIRIG